MLGTILIVTFKSPLWFLHGKLCQLKPNSLGAFYERQVYDGMEWHRGRGRASKLAAPGLILAIPETLFRLFSRAMLNP